MKTVKLIVLFLIHWIITLFTTMYAFVRSGTSKYDWLYFTVVIGIITHWMFNNDECIISYWEKKILDPQYVYGSAPSVHPSLAFYQTHRPLFSNAFMLLILGLMLYNIIALLRVYGVPTVVCSLVVAISIVYVLYFRVKHVVESDQSKYMQSDHPPKWLTDDPFLRMTYDKKASNPVGAVDVLNTVWCKLVSACKTTQVYWRDFDQHVGVLASKLHGKYDYVIGIASGGAFIAARLGQMMPQNPRPLFVKISKYDDRTSTLPSRSLHVEEISDISIIRDKRVLIVDDHILTGDTMKAAKSHIQQYRPRSVTTAVLYNRGPTCTSADVCGMPFTIASSPWGRRV